MPLDSALRPPAAVMPMAVQPVAQGLAGDAASPNNVRRLSRALAADGSRALKVQRKGVAKLQAALASMRMGDFEAGGRRALEALKIDERSGLAWHVLAICREKRGDYGQALSAYEAALSLLPNETDVASDLSRLAQRLGHLEIAEKLILKYLAANPGDAEATNNLACVLRDQNRYGDAIEALRPMIELEPGNAVLWNTLGTVLSDQGETTQALTFFDEALRLKPDFAKARYNRANALQPTGDAEAALAELEAALPGAENGYERAMMEMARGMLLLALGRLEAGYAAYEARFDPAMPDAMRVAVKAPRWTGGVAGLAGKRILAVGEQGLADEMVFGTCLPDLIEAVGPGGKVFVAVDKRTVDLYQRSLPEAAVGGHKAVKLEGRLTRYVPFVDDEPLDGWIPLGSLMALFRPTVESFPDRPGYLKPDPDRIERWTRELEALGPGLKVGLHWKSLVLTGLRARYFSSFSRWRPVLEAPGCVMINLQCGDTAADLAEAEAAGVRIWTPPIDLKDDLEDLAALSVACDVVIGPGIAGANMAAAVGARTWLIQSPDDWRHLGRGEGYPFYPQLRAFRTRGFEGWPGAIAAVRAALEAAVGGRWPA